MYSRLLLKQAKPQVIDSSHLYLKLKSDSEDLEAIVVDFFSPKLRTESKGKYSVKVIGRTPEQIRGDLNKAIIPQMRNDISKDDHQLLDKLLFRLRRIFLEAAASYTSLPETQRSSWSDVISMEVDKYQDVSIRIRHDEEEEQISTAKESSMEITSEEEDLNPEMFYVQLPGNRWAALELFEDTMTLTDEHGVELHPHVILHNLPGTDERYLEKMLRRSIDRARSQGPNAVKEALEKLTGLNWEMS
jgi:hypothetical protein